MRGKFDAYGRYSMLLPLNGGNLIVPRLMGVLKASVPLFIDVTDEKRVADIATTDFNRSPYKSER